MKKTLFKGTSAHTAGHLPSVGSSAPSFTLTKTDLSEVTLNSFLGKKLILNIFPSLDTPVCATSVRKFNQMVSELPGTEVLAVSMDLPFAHTRFCTTEGIKNVTALSAFRNPQFGVDYGVLLLDSPLKGLFARAIIVIDEHGLVLYTELVSEITSEPNYETALRIFKDQGSHSEFI